MYSSEVKKTEVLMENFRRAIGQSLSAGLWLFRAEEGGGGMRAVGALGRRGEELDGWRST